MTHEEKIQMLTGATAAVVDKETDRFRWFSTLTAMQAASLLDFAEYGVSAGGNFWALNGKDRWVFVDKALAAIANS